MNTWLMELSQRLYESAWFDINFKEGGLSPLVSQRADANF